MMSFKYYIFSVDICSKNTNCKLCVCVVSNSLHSIFFPINNFLSLITSTENI